MSRTCGLPSSYWTGGCRCDLCRQAAADYQREQRAKRSTGEYLCSECEAPFATEQSTKGHLTYVHHGIGYVIRPSRDQSWRTESACAGKDPTIFFPDVGEPAIEARQICEPCPVRVECLDFAVSTGEVDGVWGGLSPKERRSLRRRRVA